MHVRNAICLTLMVAFIAAAGCALDALSHSMSFPAFMIFGAVTVAIMVGLGFAWDRYERGRG